MPGLPRAYPRVRGSRSARRPIPWSRWQRRLAPYLFISPFYVLFVAFGLYPILFSLYLSFHRWDAVGGLGTMKWVGLGNYADLLSDPWFWKSLGNTVVLLLISGLPQHAVALPLAFTLNSGFVRLRNLFTASYFMPYITSTVAISMIFSTVYGTQYGVLNVALSWLERHAGLGGLLEAAGLELPVNWLGRARYLKPAIALVVLWRWFGWNTVLYLAGLQTIPRELYDAARVDGANLYQQFRWITAPLLKPITFFGVSLTIIGNMQLFDEPFVLTSGTGGVGESGLTVALYLYRMGFEWLYMGSAAATSWILFLVIGALSILNVKLFGPGAFGRR